MDRNQIGQICFVDVPTAMIAAGSKYTKSTSKKRVTLHWAMSKEEYRSHTELIAICRTFLYVP